MRFRLILDAMIMAICPFATMVAIVTVWEDALLRNTLLLAGILAQIIVTVLCRKDARHLYCPNMADMTRMHIERIPAAYEPGKFKVDSKVCSVCSWAGAVAPLFIYLVLMHQEGTENLPVNFLVSAISPAFMVFIAVWLILAGMVGFALWAKFGQIMEIANEGSESRRYMLRGFAEVIENSAVLFEYLHAGRSYRGYGA